MCNMYIEYIPNIVVLSLFSIVVVISDWADSPIFIKKKKKKC